MKNKTMDWLGLFALIASVIVWLQVGRSLFIRGHSEAVLFQVLSNAFYFAPVPYITGLAGMLWKISRGYASVGLSKIALLTSLPTVGVWLADRLPEMLGVTAHKFEITIILLTNVAFFFVPAITAAVAIWLAKKTALNHLQAGR